MGLLLLNFADLHDFDRNNDLIAASDLIASLRIREFRIRDINNGI
jgi:hypothetical protein